MKVQNRNIDISKSSGWNTKIILNKLIEKAHIDIQKSCEISRSCSKAKLTISKMKSQQRPPRRKTSMG